MTKIRQKFREAGSHGHWLAAAVLECGACLWIIVDNSLAQEVAQ